MSANGSGGAPALSATRWAQIQTVLLDLDGTLLDLAFDNHFWRTHVPQAWGGARSLSLEQARAELGPRFRAREGTLQWYCIDYWSRELELDIAELKRSEGSRNSLVARGTRFPGPGARAWASAWCC